MPEFSTKTRETAYSVIVSVLAICLLLGFVTEIFSLDLGSYSWLATWVSSPVALLLGLAFALTFGSAFPDFNKKMSKKLLQYSVIGLGFGMNVYKALESGSEGMMFTIASVFGTLAIGYAIGRKMLKVDSQTSYLISSGTAICGGSAIAAVGPVIKAKAESMSVALGVVFILNAVGLFIFPIIGDALGMDLKQFGMWAAIAIHDTSSVVGAGASYDAMHPEMLAQQGCSALEVATTIKLTRALWIVVLALVTPMFFKSLQQTEGGKRKPWYKSVPTFIIWFVVAILFNTYILSNAAVIGDTAAAIGSDIGGAINKLAKHMITLSLFFIGASLTRSTLKAVGIRPLIQGVLLWIVISIVSLLYIL
ncbi:MAG: putative sulfate exporter family transporter [Bacteroidaceae bacterium]|nr:putative sulfate exporter family transporter [Bacteroidaceae bacterium]